VFYSQWSFKRHSGSI